MFYGASLVNSNWLVFVATLCIFVPFMKYRARQEEKDTHRNFSWILYLPGASWDVFSTLLSERKSKYAHFELWIPFCRISLTILVWVSFLWKIEFLSVLVFILLFLSVVFRIGNSPMILLYRYTVRVSPWKTDTSQYQCHATRTCNRSFIIIHFTHHPLFRKYRNWMVCILDFALIKSISALGFCPVAKLYTCAGSGCCPFLKRFK